MPVAAPIAYEWVRRSHDVKGYMALSDNWCLQSIGVGCEADTFDMKAKLLLGAVLKKYPFKDSPWDRETVALTAFQAAEASCSRYNTRLWRRLYDCDGRPSQALQLMQEFCLDVLGPCVDFERLTRMRHGPGATTGTSSARASSYYKYSSVPYHVTARAFQYAKQMIMQDLRWYGALESWYREKYGFQPWQILDQGLFWSRVLKVVKYNRVTFVPKTVKTDRPIAIEPTLNVMLQLGVDGHVRRRLKRWGIDIDDQTKNIRLAREGSLNKTEWSPVTIDLQSASDTVSLRLVKMLLPPDWFEFLCAIRSPHGELPRGARLRYSKLSSMGNGATFAIETLVFASVCYAASVMQLGRYDREAIAVYGDDIVVPRLLSNWVVALLEASGFTVNSQKSFVNLNGVRESCGSDWVEGTNVRPVYLKECPETVGGLLVQRNSLYRWFRVHLGIGCPKLDAFFRKHLPSGCPEGPLSNEDMGSYWHTDDRTAFAYYGSVYHYSRLVSRTAVVKVGASDFRFRKLMHPLRHQPVGRWDTKPASGSAFDVVDKNRLRHHIKLCVTSFWPHDYGLAMPALRKARW